VADIVSSKFGDKVEIDLIPSSGGVFEVTIDGETLFSKKETGRFPDQDEVDGILNAIANKK
jgi:selenoprotein W-related protein